MAKSTELIVTVDIEGIDRLVREMPGRVSDFMDAEAETTVNDIKLSFGTSPSAPGDPPGVDTGALRNSIMWEPVNRFTRDVMDGVEYGIYLEFGTDRGMAPRPFMGPALKRRERAFTRDAIEFGLVV